MSQVQKRPDVIFKPDSHQYFRGDRELTSVSKVLRSVWPIKPSWDKVDPAVIENARDRGIEVDGLLSRYALGELKAIPAGTREDSRDLFLKARAWVDVALEAGPVRSQVILADETIAGTCDFIVAGPTIADLKCTYDVELSYPLQLGLYALLYEEQYGKAVEGIGIIHVTKRYPTPKWISLDVEECKRDARLIRDTWNMAQRRAG